MIDIDTSSIAYSIYFLLALIWLAGTLFLFKKKKILGLTFWTLLALNIFFYLYFMGNYRFYPKAFYPIVNNYWPWINVALFILLILNFIKNKYAKSK
jgi:hypothetical protein